MYILYIDNMRMYTIHNTNSYITFYLKTQHNSRTNVTLAFLRQVDYSIWLHIYGLNKSYKL